MAVYNMYFDDIKRIPEKMLNIEGISLKNTNLYIEIDLEIVNLSNIFQYLMLKNSKYVHTDEYYLKLIKNPEINIFYTMPKIKFIVDKTSEQLKIRIELKSISENVLIKLMELNNYMRKISRAKEQCSFLKNEDNELYIECETTSSTDVCFEDKSDIKLDDITQGECHMLFEPKIDYKNNETAFKIKLINMKITEYYEDIVIIFPILEDGNDYTINDLDPKSKKVSFL